MQELNTKLNSLSHRLAGQSQSPARGLERGEEGLWVTGHLRSVPGTTSPRKGALPEPTQPLGLVPHTSADRRAPKRHLLKQTQIIKNTLLKTYVRVLTCTSDTPGTFA